MTKRWKKQIEAGFFFLLGGGGGCGGGGGVEEHRLKLITNQNIVALPLHLL